MSDFHFIVRHALTGAVFVVFLLLALSVWNPTIVSEVKETTLDLAAKVAIAIATVPIIGVIIQGMHVSLLAFTGRLFNDEARKAVAERAKSQVNQIKLPGVPSGLTDKCFMLLRTAPNDSYFVCLYHTEADSNLIDWARRRRSYYYLGINWALAAWVGLATAAALIGSGMISSTEASRSALALPCRIVFGIVVLAAWTIGTIRLALLMKEHVDRMELIWVATRLDPGFSRLLGIEPTHRRNPNGNDAGREAEDPNTEARREVVGSPT